MSNGRRRRRSGLLAAGVVVAGLASATSAQAVDVNLIGEPYNSHAYVSIGGWVDGEQNDITVKPWGAVPIDDAIDPKFPLVPASVVVTDRTTPIQSGVGGCVPLNAHSVRCATASGIDEGDAGPGDGGRGGRVQATPRGG